MFDIRTAAERHDTCTEATCGARRGKSADRRRELAAAFCSVAKLNPVPLPLARAVHLKRVEHDTPSQIALVRKASYQLYEPLTETSRSRLPPAS